jgi:predicted SAM-dependent methyltransferase
MSFKEFKKNTLRRSAAYNGISTDLRNIRKYFRNKNAAKSIQHYIDTHEVRKLQLGANRNGLEGWLNTDLHTIPGKAFSMDVSKPFPIPDQSIDFIFSEHLIEHIPSHIGAHMLKECKRILKPSGVLRVATPDLNVLLGLLKDDLNEAQQKYISSFVELCLYDYTPKNGLEVVNHAFKGWGHQFLYTENHLIDALMTAGFSDIKRVAIGQSDYKELAGIEHHGDAIANQDMNAFETMVFEAQ